MAKPSNRTRIEQLTGKWEPAMKAAFFEAVLDITNRAELGRIVERLEKGDISGAIAAVHLDEAAFRTLDTAIAQAFHAGGSSTIGALPTLRDPSGGQFVVRYDARNLRGESILRNHSSTLITRITDDQLVLARIALTEGLAAGRNPKSVGLDLVGRVSRATGRREGGVLGLSSQQAAFVNSARSELLSGDTAMLRNYLTRGRRDKGPGGSFDKAVRRAIETGKGLDAATVSRIVGRYSSRLLELRGTTIARTETMAALGQSGIEAMQQAVDSGAVRADTVTSVWHTARDPRVRDSHAAQDRVAVPLNGVFPNGQRYPGDPAAGPAESVSCRCWCEQRIDFFAGLT